MKELITKSTSRVSAECSDIPLRETSITRLVFRPMIISNPNKPEAAIKGQFLFQRKVPNSEWVDFETISLASLKNGEGYKLEIKSAELYKLLEELQPLYKLHAESGVPRGEKKFIQATPELEQLTELSVSDINQFLSANSSVGASLLTNLLSWATNLSEPTVLVERLVDLSPDTLSKLNAAVGLQSLKKALIEWEKNSENPDEEFWQQTLTKYSFVLEQVFSWPTSIVKGKAYVGGKSVLNTGGNIVDFLMKNRLTQSAALIEIKTPVTNILGPEYRSGVYNISNDLSGSMMQIINYKHTLQEYYLSLTSGQGDLFDSFNPQCAVIIGNTATQLTNPEKIKSFELYRHQFTGSLIVTFDELFNKTQNLINMIEGSNQEEVFDDDIPF